MNTRILLTFASCLLLAGGTARAEAFVRPSVVFADPTLDGLKSTTGAGLTAGIRFGDKSHHELGLEYDELSWTDRPTTHGLEINEHIHLRPLLLSYRYFFGLPHTTVRLYLNPQVGLTQAHTSVTLNTGTWNEKAVGTNWSTCLAGGVGFTVPVGKRFELDLGYRFAQVLGNTINVTGERIQVRVVDGRAHVLHFGAAWKF